MKKIRIDVEKMIHIPYDQLVIIQGNLKELSKTDYELFRDEILRLGFSEALGVWFDEGKYKVLSGTQRVRVVKQMVEKEGFQVDPLPCCIVKADTLQDAMQKILALAKQWGKVTQDGLYEFLTGINYQIDNLQRDLAGLPGLNVEQFKDNFFSDGPDLGDINQHDTMEPSQGGITNAGQSHVRMVQLFLNDVNHPEFIQMVTELATVFGTNNLTDTVLEAVKREHNSTSKPLSR